MKAFLKIVLALQFTLTATSSFADGDSVHDCLNIYIENTNDTAKGNAAGGVMLLLGLGVLTGGSAVVAYLIGGGITGYGGLYLYSGKEHKKIYRPKVFGKIAKDVKAGRSGSGIKKLHKDLFKKTVNLSEEQVLEAATAAFETGKVCPATTTEDVLAFIDARNLEADTAYLDGKITKDELLQDNKDTMALANELQTTKKIVPYDILLLAIAQYQPVAQ